MDGKSRILASWFLNEELDEARALELTTGSLSRELGMSKATISRFCMELGYAGFAHFKSALLRDLAQKKPHAPLPSLPDTAAAVAQMSISSMADTLRALDPQAFVSAVDALAAASMTVWFGYPGDSEYLALSGEHKMIRLAMRASFVKDEQGLQSITRTLSEGDAIVVVSQSGRWKGLVEYLEAANARGCVIIVLTSKANSPLAKAADILLLAAARDILLDHGPLGLRAPLVMIIDMLVIQAAHKLGSAALPPGGICP